MSVHDASLAIDRRVASAGFSGLFSAAVMQAIPPVSDQEILQAYASTSTAAALDPASSLQAVHVQNNVMFRMIIHHAWRGPSHHSGLILSSNSLHLYFLSESTSSSNFSSLSHSHDGSGASSPRIDGIIGSAPAIDGTAIRIQPRLSPASNFQCFLCGQKLNERDYQRHIQKWVAKADTAMRGICKRRKNACPGIFDVNHPVLKTFAGCLKERVQLLVNLLDGNLHGGALDALSPEGSGRHVLINNLIYELYN